MPSFFFSICNGGCLEKRIRNLYDCADFDCCCIQKNSLEEILDCHYDFIKLQAIKGKNKICINC
ncbi:MAG: hypothetical protein A2X08_10480 [Bacteroidetes bacterium GWA2_32_17]|nr:MAG: hypothetical protein A2X08_10480 [Bacteroidetes bacterium GWA2_32_17]